MCGPPPENKRKKLAIGTKLAHVDIHVDRMAIAENKAAGRKVAPPFIVEPHGNLSPRNWKFADEIQIDVGALIEMPQLPKACGATAVIRAKKARVVARSVA